MSCGETGAVGKWGAAPPRGFLCGSQKISPRNGVGCIEGMGVRIWRISAITMRVQAQVACWSVPCILPSRLKAPMIRLANFFKPLMKVDSEHVGSFIGNQCLSCESILLPRYQHQYDCECGYDYSSNSINRPIVRVQIISGASHGNGLVFEKRNSDVGRTFYLLMGSVFCGLLAYAFLKDR